ncbi:MAG: response regulator transcription factor [Fuerstiella sp.]|nr:response regulator transcription factor [Fuerstiella sp.]
MKVLVAEDDRHTREGLVEVLQSEGYEVVSAGDGITAMRLFREWMPDFVCLDIMMPAASGYEVCKSIRAESPDLPIIFISAKAEEIDRLVGFELGADDFIVKPFSVREVVARVRAVSRRCYAQQESPPEEFTVDDLLVIPAELRARRGNSIVELSPRDVKLLQLLHDNVGKALDRNTMFRKAWGEDYLPNSRTLDQHISQLRKRVEVDPKSPRIIRTVHGVGYRYDKQSSH